jgi:hypothetical protein
MPGATSAFPYTGVVGARTDSSLAVKVDGVPEPQWLSYLFYEATTFGVFGNQDVNDASCSTANAGPALPTAVQVGANGVLYTTIDYATCVAPSVADGMSEANWSLESDSGNVLFCVNITSRTTGGVVDSVESYCAQTAEDGTLGAKARASLTESGFSVTARN